jgi:hypothetical protein
MEEILKNKLPNYKITNASNRFSYEIIKIIELCHNIDKLLVFIQRNEKNEDYFKYTEENFNTEKINIIFLNKDDIYYYDIENEDKISITIMSLKKKLLNEIDCVICLEKCINNYLSCSQCGNFIHQSCLNQCSKLICSICKYNGFIHYK